MNALDHYTDAMTKPLTHILFYHHMHFIMGRIITQYAYDAMDLIVRWFFKKNVSKADRNVRFLSREGVILRLRIREIVVGW